MDKICSRENKVPRPIPGHWRLIQRQRLWERRLLNQKGNVRHWPGRTAYIVHPPSKKRQRPAASSMMLYALLYGYRQVCVNAAADICRWAAIVSASARETKMVPGSPTQQAPHCWHSKRSPSSKKYERCCMASKESDCMLLHIKTRRGNQSR